MNQNPSAKYDRGHLVHDGTLAGLAGGIAEILWVWAYGGSDAMEVARGVALAVAIPDGSPIAGIAVHMALAAALGILAVAGWRLLSPWIGGMAEPFIFMPATLGLIWAMNFLVVLPILSPPFVALLPYFVTLTSKLLFGAAAAAVLHASRAQSALAAVG